MCLYGIGKLFRPPFIRRPTLEFIPVKKESSSRPKRSTKPSCCAMGRFMNNLTVCSVITLADRWGKQKYNSMYASVVNGP